ncbi:MAG TPA: aminotransferase class I/II-fold pyridoxal phosphate-dependent enzyme [Pyrinomonadaceae bacterium]|nr:aminotransferase class I/II-fold pyridoxal phosphate-dependent enzyme [Pyrinomonadaceae bacterium]
MLELMSKQSLDELAIFGGTPSFSEKLHVGRPNIGNRERLQVRIDDLLDRRWLTNAGPYVQKLEKELADFLGVKHCIAMCNGTVALEIAIRALGLSGEVLVPAFTFIATAHALQWQQITPVFCDIDPLTHNIDPASIEQMITPRTTGIIGVHLWGRPCDIDALTEIAKRRNLKLMFDAAHALGCSYQGSKVGTFGEAEVFSFHATKFFNSFEGGAVTTNDDDLAARMRLMSNFGFSGFDNVIYLGTNGKMSEISAAMGLTSLESLEDFVDVNRRNHDDYQRQFADLPGVTMLQFDASSNYQYAVLEIDENVTQVSRDQLIEVLMAENVIARRYFYPGCHRMEPYRSHFPHASRLLPNTEALVKRVLVLPTGTTVGKNEIEAIGQVIRLAVTNGAELRKRLSAV